MAEEVRRRRTLVLCFDGTGNKFQGDTSDSNILKIYSMLDQQDEYMYSYYQPGIGTYVTSSSYSKTGRIQKIKSWYAKAKDQAIGTSLDQHVVGGYRFLMRYYRAGDDIYLFGFSRGAYTARFLAQMLDCVGLLSPGNEEMIRFAWKTFAKWQTRRQSTEDERKEAEKTGKFMTAFRTTFSRPVRRIRFMGLFDTVNSVPRFENAWMQRSKYPYRSRLSARVVRHAVAIDERRAKFRQDLISVQHETAPDPPQHPHLHAHQWLHDRGRQPEKSDNHEGPDDDHLVPKLHRRSTFKFDRYKPRSRSHVRPISSAASHTSVNSNSPALDVIQTADDDEYENAKQDVQEIWFPGCHADIGGGWPLVRDEKYSLSHGPLLWMIREARAAGLRFDEDALQDKQYILNEQPGPHLGQAPPILQVDGQELETSINPEHVAASSIRDALHLSATLGSMHDSLVFGQGTGFAGVMAWTMMEYLPFRRMDLKEDGKWAPIRWPLPCGETRDIPHDALIHNSALRRMDANEDYRPGNLIVGGGGRGVRRAPKEKGTGKWLPAGDEADIIGGVVVRDKSGDSEKK